VNLKWYCQRVVTIARSVDILSPLFLVVQASQISYAEDNWKNNKKEKAQNKMLYTLKVVATMIVSFAAGIVLHRILWRFFDWLLDKLEDMDDKY